MTYADRLEEIPFVAKFAVAFAGGAALMVAGLIAMTFFLLVLKIAIVGLC